jgi:hypothetical protein
MSDYRQFIEPSTIAEAISRKRMLERDIWNIERQLAEPRREQDGKPIDRKQYRSWRSKAHTSLVFKKAEQAFLKDWIIERRRAIEAGKLGIFDPNDPKELLVKTRAVLKKALAGDDLELGQLYNVIDQYLQHAA